jgi:hypothetical protein
LRGLCRGIVPATVIRCEVVTVADGGRVRVTRYASTLWYPDSARIDVFATVTYLADGERVTVTASDVGETHRIVAGRDRRHFFYNTWDAVRDMLQSYIQRRAITLNLAADFEFGHGLQEIAVTFSGAKVNKADAAARLAAGCVALAASIVAAMCCYDDLIAEPADSPSAPRPG